MGKGRRAVCRKNNEKKGAHVQDEPKHVGLTIIGIIILIFITCFIILTLRKFYILNTYAVVMGEYGKKNNYKVTMQSNEGVNNVTYYKDGISVLILNPNQNRQMYCYNDGNESILRIDSDGNKVAIISEPTQMNGAKVISAFGEGMTAWQNFLLSFTTMITEEECNGKDCYKVTLNGMKVWIDKETYLTARVENGYAVSSDGNKTPLVNNYSYEFGTVTDKQVSKPDLTGYKIQKQ